MKTIHVNYKLLFPLSLFLIIGCVANKKASTKNNRTTEETRTLGNNTRIEVCHNCQVKFKTTLVAQKMAMNSPTSGFCAKCTAEYHKAHP